MFQIAPYREAHRDQVVALSLRAWSPVFARLRDAVPSHAYDAFYPSGWKVRQTADIEAFLHKEQDNTIVATQAKKVIGWTGMRLHPEDRMGEVYILAVDPDHQRQGVATALIAAAETRLREVGMKIVMVETGDDPGHAPSRRTYETNGFERWPVARYFISL